MSIQIVSNVYSAGFTSTILPSIFSMETGFSGSMNSPMLLASTSVEPIRTLPIGASLEQVFTTSPTFTSSPDSRSTFPAMSVFNAIFSSVVVVTDRTVLDAQLQETISGFDHTLGAVETIGEDKNQKAETFLKAFLQRYSESLSEKKYTVAR